MGASYPEGHIPQDVYEARLKPKPAEPVKKVKPKPKIIPMPKIMPTKPEEARIPFMKDEPEPEMIPTEATIWKMKYKEQIETLKKLGNYDIKFIKANFKYEKDRVAEIIRLYKKP